MGEFKMADITSWLQFGINIIACYLLLSMGAFHIWYISIILYYPPTDSKVR